MRVRTFPLLDTSADQIAARNIAAQEVYEPWTSASPGDGAGRCEGGRIDRRHEPVRVPPDEQRRQKQEGRGEAVQAIMPKQRCQPRFFTHPKMRFVKDDTVGWADEPGEEICLPVSEQGLVAERKWIGAEHNFAVAQTTLDEDRKVI